MALKPNSFVWRRASSSEYFLKENAWTPRVNLVFSNPARARGTPMTPATADATKARRL